MPSREPKRFVVSHQKGKRKRVYSREQFLRLQSRLRSWANFRLSDCRAAIQKQERKLDGMVRRLFSATHFPSELEFYSNTIDFSIGMFRLAEAEFNYSKGMLEYFANSGNAFPLSAEQLGWAVRRIQEAPLEMNQFEAQIREFRDFEATTKRTWNSCWVRLEKFVINRPLLFRESAGIYERREEAKEELLAIRRAVDKQLGKLEMGIASGMKRSRDRNREQKRISKPLLVAREKMALIEQEWNSFWIRAAFQYKDFQVPVGEKKKPLRESFVNELVRRKEKAVEDTIRIRRLLPPNH